MGRGVIGAIWNKRWQIGLAIALLAGIIFRLAYLQDIEYKSDESWTFANTEAFWQTHQLPMVGSASSQGLPNAGLSLWLFIALEAFVPADPLAVTRAVEVVNVAALLMLVLFVARCVDAREREPWAWSLALVAVNPLWVLFSRKIWEQDLLPPFSVGFLWGWWYRARNWGAFLWGLIGALIGQIHLGGFFYGAAFFLVTMIYDRRGVKWLPWLCGSVLGALPMLPWIYAILTTPSPVSTTDWTHLNPVYWLHWLGFASALNLFYSLGRDTFSFLATPIVGGVPTYLAAALHVALLAIVGIIFTRLYRHWRLEPAQTKALLFSPRSQTALALAALLLQGLLFLPTLRPVYLHYLIIGFPLPALSLVWLDRAGVSSAGSVANSRALLTWLVILQAALTVLFQLYVHQAAHIAGDYGTPYRMQVPAP